MDKTWLWKKRSSEHSPGESESSESFSSYSARYSDEQDASRESQNESIQSPQVTSKASVADDRIKESEKSLTEKLSAALVNISAKEDLVKQHAKVAEEAVAGWEKSEKEVTMLKQQLEAATQRLSHLDGAIKECVRQLRLARDEHETKEKKWELSKAGLEAQIVELQTQLEAARTEKPEASVDLKKSCLILETLKEENTVLKQEIALHWKELKVMAIDRDLSTQAAETASKLQLESIMKVAKLEAECRRLQSIARKSSPFNNPKSISYAESLTDSGDRLNVLDIDAHSTCGISNVDTNASEPSCSDSWALALIAELDQFKKDKALPKSIVPCSSEGDLMDDFLEMERLAAMPETMSDTPFPSLGNSVSTDNELNSLHQRAAELEKKLKNMEANKSQVEAALDETRGFLKEAEKRVDELQKELHAANEAKECIKSQLIDVEEEARTISANVVYLEAEIEKERILSAQLRVRCQEMEHEQTRKGQETKEIQQFGKLNCEPKVKQEDLTMAANKLVECQKTIASLGRQLKSLGTFEDFLVTANIPGLKPFGLEQ